MAWKQVELGGRGRHHFGPGWGEDAAISLTKQGITFNEVAATAYGLKAGDFVSVFLDVDRRMVGFKRIDGMEGYKIRYIQKAGGGRRGRTLHTGCAAAAKAFPDCVGRAFRLELTEGDEIIVAELSPENRLQGRREL